MERKNALYLDADIICTGNLKDLFNVKFSCVIGIVEDRLGANSQKRKLSELGIPSNERCFNSGVMLIDIDRYVEDDVLSKFIDCIKK